MEPVKKDREEMMMQHHPDKVNVMHLHPKPLIYKRRLI